MRVGVRVDSDNEKLALAASKEIFDFDLLRNKMCWCA